MPRLGMRMILPADYEMMTCSDAVHMKTMPTVRTVLQ